MLVPRSSLLFWVAVLVVPFATLAGMLPESAPLAAVLIMILLVAVLFDAAWAFNSVADVTVESSETVRLFKDRPGEIELRFQMRLPTIEH